VHSEKRFSSSILFILFILSKFLSCSARSAPAGDMPLGRFRLPPAALRHLLANAFSSSGRIGVPRAEESKSTVRRAIFLVETIELISKTVQKHGLTPRTRMLRCDANGFRPRWL